VTGPRRFLSEEDHARMLKLLANPDLTHKIIAQRFGVSELFVSKIARGLIPRKRAKEGERVTMR
jgi:transposase-like protein